ncbi:MAG: hypothetical protein QOI82_3576 [Actinomycetota bacterium]|jgi:Arc/MetJ-type ribon-helix-helix transcriptional regulator|nr:hypothetical protein [Actinomycetota bacterium]
MTTKIAISLPDDQVAALKRAAAEGRAPSVSALISEALSEKFQRESLASLVADIIAEDGPPSAADYAWADEALKGL